MHDAKYQNFRFGQVVKHHMGESLDWPVANAVVNRCASLGICNQLINGSPNACDKV
jgi:hypothetical protein